MAAVASICQSSLLRAGRTDVSCSGRAPEAVLQDAERITVHSGNIVSWNKLRRRTALTTTDELVLGSEAALKSWLGRGSEIECRPELFISNAGLVHKVGREERNNLVFSLKVFLSDWDRDLLRTAVITSMEEIGVSTVNSVFVAFPPSSPSEETSSKMIHVWQGVEQLVRDGLTETVGVADLMRPQLEELYHSATIKPMADQLNLAHCCTIPQDLKEFAKERDITLNTHNDERDILSPHRLQALVGGVCGNHDNHWKYSWATRYTSVVHMRGILAHKGYLMELQKSE